MAEDRDIADSLDMGGSLAPAPPEPMAPQGPTAQLVAPTSEATGEHLFALPSSEPPSQTTATPDALWYAQPSIVADAAPPPLSPAPPPSQQNEDQYAYRQTTSLLIWRAVEILLALIFLISLAGMLILGRRRRPSKHNSLHS
jgi:hypothetical protein